MPAVSRPARRAAVFLDRDGTLVEEVPYLHEPELVRLVPGARAALRELAAAGFALVVVTNQAGVAKGYYGEEAVGRVHRRLRELLAAGGVTLDGVWYCPHHPEGAVPRLARPCRCRKPGPGMLEAAAAELGLDLPASYLIGNHPTDAGAARAGGVTPLLVTTEQAAGRPAPEDVPSFGSLVEAAAAILARSSAPAPP
ncbi:MAG TPA: HAD family hydrolase [Actinomycetota bacterium]|nr:HAD family hydrolase [Actinomycetota bacterium]